MVRTRIGAAIGAALLVAVVGATVAAAATVGPYSGNPTGVTLGMFGDSITNQSRAALHQSLDVTYRSSIAAYPGATVDSMTADGTIAAMAAKNPAVIVFNLGTNDLVQVVINPTAYPLTAFEADYTAMRAKFKACAVVTTINTHRIYGGSLTTVPNGIAIFNNKARQFNIWLRAHYAHVADWDALTTSWWNAGTWSTYMQTDSIHPTLLGQEQLALIVREQADTCYPSRVVTTTSTKTTVDDAGTSTPWAGTEVTGASAYDTATVSGSGRFTPTGSVTYSFFTNSSCSGSPSTTQKVTLNSGAVPNSSTVGPLATASYSFDATYGGDGNNQASVSACEPFTVTQAATTTATTVDDAGTSTPWAGTEVTGASAYDTATVSGSGSITPTGTVTYSFFTNSSCAGSPNTTEDVTLNSGAVPNSSTVGPLATASYSFDATYGGDGNNQASVSACEPFTVTQAATTTATTVDDAGTSTPWAGTEVTGASAYDTATVSGSGSITPTGTVTYSFFTNSSCSGSPNTTEDVTLNSGAVPNSSTVGPLATASYSFDATYGGDGNNQASVSACEPFTVN